MSTGASGYSTELHRWTPPLRPPHPRPARAGFPNARRRAPDRGHMDPDTPVDRLRARHRGDHLDRSDGVHAPVRRHQHPQHLVWEHSHSRCVCGADRTARASGPCPDGGRGAARRRPRHLRARAHRVRAVRAPPGRLVRPDHGDAGLQPHHPVLDRRRSPGTGVRVHLPGRSNAARRAVRLHDAVTRAHGHSPSCCSHC